MNSKKRAPRFSRTSADGSARADIKHCFLKQLSVSIEDMRMGYLVRPDIEQGKDILYALYVLPAVAYQLINKSNSVKCIVSFQHLYKNGLDEAEGLRYVAVAKLFGAAKPSAAKPSAAL